MGIISWLIFGLIVGTTAKFIMPGKDPGGIIVTSLIGIAGAFVGGFVSSLLGFGSTHSFSIVSMAIATGGALILLFGYRQFRST